MVKNDLYTPEILTSLLLEKLKLKFEEDTKEKVKKCVISVPSFFTSAQRSALIKSAREAKLKNVHLLNETMSVAVLYGSIHLRELPQPEEDEKNVAFVDFGQSQLQVAICAYRCDRFRMVKSAHALIGGRDIDAKLVDHFVKRFPKKHAEYLVNNPYAYVQLLTKVKQLKEQMLKSRFNETELPVHLYIYRFFGADENLADSITYTEMLTLCEDIFSCLRQTCADCIRDSGIFLKCLTRKRLNYNYNLKSISNSKHLSGLASINISAVEIVGGSTKILKVQSIIEETFGKTVSTSLGDAAVSRGAAISCAKSFVADVIDVHNIPVRMAWKPLINPESGLKVFKASHEFPAVSTVKFSCEESFGLHLFYDNTNFPMDPFIGKI